MKAKKRLIPRAVVLAALLLCAAAYFFLLPRRPDFARLRGRKDFNVILITLDTTRADRIGCYGFKNIETPTIDMFAARGIRFEDCISTTPLTLPAHTSIMTGTLPPFHGVRDNGGFVVPAGIETLAKLFKGKGYATSAFVAAYVLDSHWGLSRGFDVYYDRFDLSKFETISLGNVQRPGNEVIDQVLPWLEQNKGRKFFTWVHLYDPHTPYEPPAPYDKLYAEHPYLGEIAFADSQIGRLWQYLEAHGLTENLFLVFAADHGESLGEHEEGSHGFFVYQAAVRVPLIFVTPFPKLQGLVSPGVVSIADIMPTICEMAGIPVPPQVQGKSLAPAFFNPKRTPGRYAYAETFYPRFHYGWSELQSIQDARYKLILAPVPELYDLVADPREEKNLVYLEKKVFEDMSAAAQKFIAKSSENAYEFDLRKIDEETREKLAALGYIGSFTDPAKLKGKKLGNPREKIGVFNELNRAREIGMSGQAEEAIKIVKGIIATDPDVTDAYFALGNIYFKGRRFKEAIVQFLAAFEKKPDDAFTVINVANSYIAMRKFDEAEAFVLDYFKKGFSDAQLYHLLGNMNFVQKKYDKAIPYFEKCLSLNDQSVASHIALAAIYINQINLVKADEHIQAALRINPEQTNVHYNLAQLLEKQGRMREAADAYLQEIRISPRHLKALFNLSRLYRLAGDEDKELEYLKKAVEADPRFPMSYLYLARINLNRGTNYQEAITMAKKGIDLGPDKSDLALGYFLLADLYNRIGEHAQSQEYAEKGQALAAELQNKK
jgi:arylsulfatase A-like enzyme/Tfp pilus assembly protein PilF